MMRKSAYDALQDILHTEPLDSVTYTETNEGIELTLNLDELGYLEGSDDFDKIKNLFYAYGYVGPIDFIAEEEEFITVNIPYNNHRVVESNRRRYKRGSLKEAISRKQKERLNLLNDIVNFAYEYGESETKSLFQQAFKKAIGDDLIESLSDED